MGNEILILFRIDHDNLENKNALVKQRVGIFASKGGVSAQGNLSKYIEEMSDVSVYLGYDGGVYPQWVIEKDFLK